MKLNVIQVPNHDYFFDTEERGFNLQSVTGLHNSSPIIIISVLKSLHSAMVLLVVTSTICFSLISSCLLEIPAACFLWLLRFLFIHTHFL